MRGGVGRTRTNHQSVMEHRSCPTNYPGRTPIQIVGRFVVLFDFPGFLILHQPPERYGTCFESDQVRWWDSCPDSRSPSRPGSPLLFSGDLDGCPTRGVGRTPRYSTTLFVGPSPTSSTTQSRILEIIAIGCGRTQRAARINRNCSRYCCTFNFGESGPYVEGASNT